MESNLPTPAIAQGATVQPHYMGRTMKCYPVYEAEVESLSTLNAQATTFFSACTFFLALGFGVLTNAVFADTLTAQATVAVYLGVPSLVVVALVFAGLGLHALRSRASVWKSITKENQGAAPAA